MSNCEKIKEYINSGWILVDVREPDEYAQGKIMDAINIPMKNVDKYIKSEKYLVYCRSGGRSGAVATYLAKEGYEVINIGGVSQYLECVE